MVKVDVICIKIWLEKINFYFKPIPCGQEPSNLGDPALKNSNAYARATILRF